MTDRILITDDHPLVCDGLRALLASAFTHCRFEEAYSLKDAMEQLSADQDFDLITLDLDLPDAKQLEALGQLRARFPSIPIAVLSANKDPVIARAALSAGAAGFISKSQRPEILLSALRTILDGGTYAEAITPATPDDEDQRFLRKVRTLTPQQRTVFGMIVQGRLNKQIAYELSISLTTVKAHVSAVLAKLEVANRTQAAILAKRLQLVP